MSKQDQSTLELLSTLPQPGEYIIRQGLAIPNISKEALIVESTINGPYLFYQGKYLSNHSKDYPKEGMLVLYNYEKGYLKYHENTRTDERCAHISGAILKNKDLEEFGINNQKLYTTAQLAQLLKFNRALFYSPDECMELVTSLKSFTAKVSSEIQNINDNQGNKTHALIQQISHGVKLDFTLNTVLFTHQSTPKKFKVEILLDVRDKAVEFWLESVELKELIQEETKAAIDAEIANFQSNDITCILS